MKRRKFIKNAGTTAAFFTIIPRHVLGGKGYIPPSDKLNIAAIGCGGKGAENIRRSYNGGTDNIVALCDVDDRMAVDARKAFPSAPYYRDFRELLDKEDKNIDAVLVSTPDHMQLSGCS